MKHGLLAASLLLVAAAFTAPAASMIGIDPPSSVVVFAGGLEWVYAAPCAPSGCGTITLHHGFRLPTTPEWTSSFSDLSDMYTQFSTPNGKCASPYFSDQYDHCDFGDLQLGYVYGSPFAPDDGHRFHPLSETFLVRGEGGGEIPEPASYLLTAIGLSAVALIRRRRADVR
ncbi:MAG: PEP-CTERM sorting domain-containing protein [Acidobacteriota bacterium]